MSLRTRYVPSARNWSESRHGQVKRVVSATKDQWTTKCAGCGASWRDTHDMNGSFTVGDINSSAKFLRVPHETGQGTHKTLFPPAGNSVSQRPPQTSVLVQAGPPGCGSSQETLPGAGTLVDTHGGGSLPLPAQLAQTRHVAESPTHLPPIRRTGNQRSSRSCVRGPTHQTSRGGLTDPHNPPSAALTEAANHLYRDLETSLLSRAPLTDISTNAQIASRNPSQVVRVQIQPLGADTERPITERGWVVHH